MNIVAIIVSCIALNVLGMFWYSPSAFGPQWMELMGIKWPKDKKKQDEMKEKGKKDMPKNIGLNSLANLVSAVILSLLISYTGLTGLTGGLTLGFLAWLGFVATRALNSVLWEGKPFKLYLIHMGHDLVGLLIMGAILGVWM